MRRFHVKLASLALAGATGSLVCGAQVFGNRALQADIRKRW